MTRLLALENVSSGYGASVVVEDATFAIDEGECVAVLGRNGVGKTTLLETIGGHTTLHRGTLRWRGRDLAREPAHRRARLGLGWVPQERGMWRSLTVREHLAAVARPGPWTPARAFELFPRLGERRSHRGDQLSGGEQQMLAVARALVTNPRMLLLDEPLEGLAPIIVRDLVKVLRDLAASGKTALLLVEQHAQLALSVSSRALVMDRGRIVLERPSAALAADHEALSRWLTVEGLSMK
jgi:branched-chain amino acid transport system ATP-binding protein